MDLFWIGIIIRIGDWYRDAFPAYGACQEDIYWWLRK